MKYKIEKETTLQRVDSLPMITYRVVTIYNVYKKGFTTFFKWTLTKTCDTMEQAEDFIEEQE